MSFRKKQKSRVVGVEEGYDLYASAYDQDLPFLDSFEGREGEVMMRVLGDLEGKKVLDLGCGTGRLVPGLASAGAEVVGADLSEGMIEKARKKFPRFEFEVADSEKLPFEDESFDVVVAAFLVVHLGELEPSLREVYRVLKPGGVFVLSNVNQRKAPKLKTKEGEEIVIKSFYHMPKKVLEALESEFFEIEMEEFVKDRGVWINQIVRARRT